MEGQYLRGYVDLPEYFDDVDFQRRVKALATKKAMSVDVNDLPYDWTDEMKVRFENADSEERIDIFNEWLTNTIAENNPSVRCNLTSHALEGISKDGRFKTQFETSYSGGWFNPKYRSNAELEGLAVPAAVDAKQRPIYGTLTFNDNHTVAGQYGSYEVVFKQDVLNKATFTIGDSLSNFAGGDVIGSPVFNPSITSTLSSRMTTDILYGNIRGRQNVSYIETQIHGGVTVDDIDTIFVDDAGYVDWVKKLFPNAKVKVK